MSFVVATATSTEEEKVVVERKVSVPNHVTNILDHAKDTDTEEDDWTMIPKENKVETRHDDDVDEDVDVDESTGIPCNVVVVEFPPSMNVSHLVVAGSMHLSNNVKHEEGIDHNKSSLKEKEEDVDAAAVDASCSNNSVTSTIASSFVHQLQQHCTVTTTSSSSSNDDRKLPPPQQTSFQQAIQQQQQSEYNMNSDRHCRIGKSNNSSSSHNNSTGSQQWSIVEEQQGYRITGGVARSDDYNNNNGDKSSVSTWNTATNNSVTTYKYNDDDNINDTDDRTTESVSGTNSTISGFDIISLNGTSSQRACSRCTYLNLSTSLFCEICDTTLIVSSNPCLDVDAILAQQLQNDEDQQAFSQLQINETKRQSMFVRQSLLVQSHTFQNDIYRFMNDFTKQQHDPFIKNDDDIVGYDVVPVASLVILASRFIETMITRYRQKKSTDVLIRYCVTPKMDGLYHQKVKENSFPPNSVFSLDFKLALRNKGMLHNTNTLGFIPEESTTVPPAATTYFTSSNSITDHLGWIAAIVKGDGTKDTWISDDKCYTTVPNRSQTVPLVCFDASLWNKPATKSIFQGLIRVCNDFFDTMEIQIADDIKRKKARLFPTPLTTSEQEKGTVAANTAIATSTTTTTTNNTLDDSDKNEMVDDDDGTTYLYDDDDDYEEDEDDIKESSSNLKQSVFAQYGSIYMDNDHDSDNESPTKN